MFCLYKAERPVFEVALAENDVIHVYPASMSMAQKMQNIDTKNFDVLKLYELVAEILSNNKEKWKISVSDIEAFDVNVITEMIVEFGNFMRGINADPN